MSDSDQNVSPKKSAQTVPENTPGDIFAAVHTMDGPDTVSAWAELYFQIEVTTSERSRQEQRRDLQLFLDFVFAALGHDRRAFWTHRLSRYFVDTLRQELKADGTRRRADRTLNRIVAHLKTFSKWIHAHRRFPNGDPMTKIRSLGVNGQLELEQALTEDERRRLLDAADHLPVIGGRSHDRRRNRAFTLADERARRKGYRPWRNHAIVYTLIETGMRRAEITTLDRPRIDFVRSTLLITEKSGQQRRCQISKEGLRAIRDDIDRERGADAACHPHSPALFLPASTSRKNTRGSPHLASSTSSGTRPVSSLR